MRIHYNISPLHQCEAGVRLSDAMLYAALKSVLGEQIDPFSSLHDYNSDGPLWGLDHFNDPEVMRRRAAAFREPAVLAAIGGVIVPAREAGAAMDRLSERGIRPGMRSMADPIERQYFPGLGGKFDKLKDRIRVRSDDDEVLIHPHYDLVAERRYLIVAGEIAAETPFSYCDEDPAQLLDPENRMRAPKGFLGELVEADPRHLALQQTEAEALLADYPMVSGAIDVGIVKEPGGETRAQITEVTAARPGGAHTIFADPMAYARKIAEHLHELEPSLAEGDTLKP